MRVRNSATHMYQMKYIRLYFISPLFSGLMKLRGDDSAAKRLQKLQGRYVVYIKKRRNNCPHARRLRYVSNEVEKFSTQLCDVFTRAHKHASVPQIVS